MNFRPIIAILAALMLADACSAKSREEVYALKMSGSNLTAEEAEKLEKQVEQNPQDDALRTQLLGYYFGKGSRNSSAREAKRTHILWLIENSPESGVLATPYGQLDAIRDTEAYTQGKKSWIGQLKKQHENLKLLENSAAYFQFTDRELAIASLEKASSLDKDNPQWPAALGHLYQLDMNSESGTNKQQTARKAVKQFEIAFELSTADGRDALLSSLAKTALAAGDPQKAKGYAEQMLKQNIGGWNSGNNIHHGNLILGRIALAKNDVDEAKERLIDAGKTPGSPQLNSFGPNMLLAKELLQQGEKDIVLEYFKLCSKFWKLGDVRLKEWTAAVKEDEIPEFGPNLIY